ncbi:MAG: hypothetical protein JNK58_09640 [Phycisphaerae bacterium]|nr:hypothetical protein [Phycisphaerae bacterium]
MRCRTNLGVAFLLSLAALCGEASAQRGEPPPPLGGPPVRDRNAPGAGNTFGEPMPGEKPKANRRVAPRVFFESLRSLDDEGTPPDLRPTREQREELREIVQDFMGEVRAFRRARADREGPPPPGVERGPRPPHGSGEPRADGPPPPPRPGDERRGPQEGRGPNPDGCYARVWEVLDADQQAFLRERIEAAQRERMMQREEPIVREGVRKRLAEVDPMMRDLAGLSREERRARLREMSPEQREEVRLMLRERRERAGAPPRDHRPEDRPPPPPPPPSEMDEVDRPRVE